MSGPRPTPASRGGTFSRKALWFGRVGVAVDVILALYILMLVNIIIFRHPWRIDLTEEALNAISDETRVRLDLVREEIRVVVPFYLQPGNPEHAAHIEVLERALWLLKEYSAVQPLIAVPEKVNVFREGDRWKKLCDTYDLAPGQHNRIIFMAGKDYSVRRVVTVSDLAILDEPRDKRHRPQIKQFRGETAMTAAIVKLVERDHKRVYFTQGHGELALKSKGEAYASLGAFRHDLDGAGFEAHELFLDRVRGVPRDCAMLVIAGPEQAFSPKEIEQLEQFLIDDGRLMVTLGAKRTGLESVLKRWGITVHKHELRRRIKTIFQRAERDRVLVGGYHMNHPITKPFRNDPQFQMQLLLPRPLRVTGGLKRLETLALLNTGPRTDNVDHLLVGSETETLTKEESEGDFILAAATMEERVTSPPPDYRRRKTRIVVLAASNVLRDFGQVSASVSEVWGGYRSNAHSDVVMNCVNWLVGEEEKIALGGQSSVKRELPPLKSAKDPSLNRFLFIVSVFVFPGIFICIGMGVYFLRRT